MGNPYLVIVAVALLLPTLCAGQNSTYCPNGNMTENEVNCQILSLINTRRASLATGNQYNGWMFADEKLRLPPAKDMKKMTYNCTLEQEAADFSASDASKMISRQSQIKAFFSSGDIIALRDSCDYTEEGLTDMADVIWQYAAEIDNMFFSSFTEEGQPVKYAAEDTPALKYYANLMNGRASQIGCTFTTCDNAGDEMEQLLCLTDAPNLQNGDEVYNVSTVTGCDCQAPLTCDSGLCIEIITTTQAPTVTTSAAVTSGTAAPAAETTTLLSLAEFPGSSTAEPSTWCDWKEISDTMRMHMSDTHNFRRSTLALGQITDNTGATLPAATNMNYLRWNCTLEKEAHDFLRSCPTEGYQRPSDDLPAQNFYRAPIGSLPTYRDMNKKTVTEWWKPVRKVAGPGQSAYFRSSHSSSDIKSYTLMGWANTHQIGCSIAKCGSDWVEACRYYPPGNKPDTQQYKPGKACSQCETLGTGPCDASLGLCG